MKRKSKEKYKKIAFAITSIFFWPFVLGFLFYRWNRNLRINKRLKSSLSVIIIIVLSLSFGYIWTAGLVGAFSNTSSNQNTHYNNTNALINNIQQTQNPDPNPTSQNNNENKDKTEQDQSTQPPKSELYSVAKVLDGDTIDVNINGKTERLRLIGIDTPETLDPRKPVQCFGKEASDKAKEILNDKKVSLENDPVGGERDKYNRLLRYVFLEDSTNFNKLMISEGYAHEYTYQSQVYKYQSEFEQAEKEARDANRGLWSPNACNGDTSKPAAPSIQPTSNLPIKMSRTSICHAPGTTYYDRTTNFTQYKTLDECLSAGGRLPKR